MLIFYKKRKVFRHLDKLVKTRFSDGAVKVQDQGLRDFEEYSVVIPT
jgi:hypothetical protein